MKRKVSVLLLLVMVLNLCSAFGVMTVTAEDVSIGEPNAIYVTPTGAGTMDGSSWDNAMCGDKEGGLQDAWDKAPANGTVYVGSGTYTTIQKLTMTGENDGLSETEMKRLIGVDTGEGKPVFVGRYEVEKGAGSSNQDTFIQMTYTTTTPVPLNTPTPTPTPLPSVDITYLDRAIEHNISVKYTNAAYYTDEYATDLVIKGNEGEQLYVGLNSDVSLFTLSKASNAYVEEIDAYSLSKILSIAFHKLNKSSLKNFRLVPVGSDTVSVAVAKALCETVEITATPAPEGEEAGESTFVIDPESLTEWELITDVYTFNVKPANQPEIPEGATVLFTDDFESESYELLNPKRAGAESDEYTDQTAQKAREELAAMGWIATENTGHYGIVSFGENNMLKTAKIGSANSNIYKTFTPVMLKDGTKPSEDTVVLGANGKLVMEYDLNIQSDKSSRQVFFGFGYGENPKSSRSASYFYQGNSYKYPLYYVAGGSNTSILTNYDTTKWVHIKEVVNVKDANGNYVSTVDTYIDGVPVAIGKALSTADAKYTDKFFMNTNIYSAGTSTFGAGSNGVSVDNVAVYYYEGEGANVTEAPAATAIPTPTPKPTTPEPAPNLTGCGASYVEIANLQIDKYYFNIKTNGKNVHLVFNDIDSNYCSDTFYLQGGATTKLPDEGIKDVEIYDCNIYGNTKKGVRTRDGIDGLVCRNVKIDMGSQELWASENWPVGFGHGGNQSGVKDKNITLIDCMAKGSWQQETTGYWNGDGIATEGDVENFTTIRCYMYSSTDGGWDCKGKNLELYDCIAMDNKRNFRFWGNTTMTNCVSAFADNRGGSGGQQGFWTCGDVVMNNCTFYDNNGSHMTRDTERDLGSCIANDCIFVTTEASSGWLPIDHFTYNRCVFYNKGVGVDPQLYNPHFEAFETQTTAFNSLVYGASKGYYTSPESVGEEPLPTAAPTVAPSNPPEIDEDGNATLVLLNETFENYETIDDVIAGGWNVSYTTTEISPAVTAEPPAGYDEAVSGTWTGEVITEAVVTNVPNPTLNTYSDGSGKYLRDLGSSSIEFSAPIPLNPTSGYMLGANTRCEIEFDGTIGKGTSSSGGLTANFSFKGDGVLGIALGYRQARSNRLDFGVTSPASTASNLMAAYPQGSFPQNAHFKIVLDITDENGEYYQKIPVTVYYNGVATIGSQGLLNTNSLKWLDTFSMSGAGKSIDNLSVKLISSQTAKEEHNVTAAVTSGEGSVSPASASVLTDGAKTITITKTNAEDVVAKIKVNGVAVENPVLGNYKTNSYQFTVDNITADTHIEVEIGADKNILLTAINAAKELYNKALANIGDQEGQYTQDIVTALNTAIESAEAIYDKTDASSDEITNAVTALNAVVGATVTNTPTPTPVPEEADKDALNAKIAEAEALYETASSNTGDAPGQYKETVVSALNSVIAAAKEASSDRWITQEDADAFVVMLENAMNHCIPNGEATPTPEPLAAWDGVTMTEPQKDENGTYLVCAPAEFAWLVNFVNADTASNKGINIKFTRDIDMGNVQTVGFSTFAGTIDGQGHVIKNLYIYKNAATSTAGLIEISESATVKNLGIEGEISLTKTSTGGGHNSRHSVAGAPFVARAQGSTRISDCYFKGDVKVYATPKWNTVFGAGGIAGRVESASVVIENCYSQGTIHAKSARDGSGTGRAGGIIGANGTISSKSAMTITEYACTIANCYSTMSISTDGTAKAMLTGPVVGESGTEGTVPAVAPIITNTYYMSTFAITPALGTSTDETALANGTVAIALGSAYKQGEGYPILAWEGSSTVVPEPTPEPTPEPVDKTALDDALTAAYELFDNASANVGDAEGQYSQALVTALNVAIETAKAVYDNAEADQATVDQAIVDLNAVVATVVPNTATPTPEPTEEPTPAPTEEPTPEPTPEPTTPPVADVAYGDADGNGEVAVEDATAILRYKAGLLGEADINLDNADADGNGEVAVEDATAILRYKAGLLANLGPQTA